MTQEFRALVELAEADLDPEKLGFSLFAAHASDTPRVLWLVEGETIIWAAVDWAKVDLNAAKSAKSALESTNRPVKWKTAEEFTLALTLPFSVPTSGLLANFIRIRNAQDVLRFGRRFGPLQLCQHGYPGVRSDCSPLWDKYHGNSWCDGRPATVEGKVADIMATQHVTLYQEKVSDWLRFARIGEAVLAIGLADRAVAAGHRGGNRLGKEADWETLLRDWWGRPYNAKATLERVFRDRDFGHNLVRLLVQSTVSQWIRMGQGRPSLDWRRNKTKPSLYLAANTFGHLGIQLATTLAATTQFTVCDGCGLRYGAKKPRTDRANYCPDCQAKRVPARDRKRRFRENHPDYDRTYRAKQTLAKEESDEQTRE